MRLQVTLNQFCPGCELKNITQHERWGEMSFSIMGRLQVEPCLSELVGLYLQAMLNNVLFKSLAGFTYSLMYLILKTELPNTFT